MPTVSTLAEIRESLDFLSKSDDPKTYHAVRAIVLALIDLRNVVETTPKSPLKTRGLSGI